MTYWLRNIFWLLFWPFMTSQKRFFYSRFYTSNPEMFLFFLPNIIVDTRLSFFFLSSVAHLLCSSSLNTEKCIGKACNGIHEILLQSSPSPRSNAAGKNQRWAYNESPYFQSIVELLRALRSNIFPINILGTCMAFKKFQASSSTFLTKSIRHKSLPNVVYVSNSCVEIIGILEEVCMWKVSKSHYLVK